jgi:hypothetical protein
LWEDCVRWRSLAVLFALALIGGAACNGWNAGGASPSPTLPPAISGVSPARAAVGDTVVMTGSGFATVANHIKIGPGYVHNLPSSNGTSISFTLPSYVDVCPPFAEGACPAVVMAVTPGTYALSVITRNGTSNAVDLVVR